MKKSILLSFAALAAWAQPAPPPPPPAPPEPPHGMVEFIATEGMRFSNKAVKGMPYAAEGVNETSQVLADGNRITRKTSSSVYRDSQGRTRNEHAMPSVGPWASKGEKLVTIFDPVSKTTMTLHPDKTATKISMPSMEMGPVATFERRVEGPTVVVMEGRATGAEGRRVVEKMTQDIVIGTTVDIRGGAVPTGRVRSGMTVTASPSGGRQSVRTEDLGKKAIEGVEAEGKRTVMTIEAGEIGNDRPIEVVDETWYSKELEALVYSKHSDPRTGESIYRLTNIRRGEQPSDLFEIPADYKVRDGLERFEFKMKQKE